MDMHAQQYQFSKSCFQLGPQQAGTEVHGYMPLLEAGSNTSTIALRVVRGDEKETQCLGI
jgi:hypothetical protein